VSWEWQRDTGPFFALGSDDRRAPAQFVVEQVGDRHFEIADGFGFRYEPPDGTPVVVDRATLGRTDFASIPSFMSWFVSRYGRHTPAALVHDQLIEKGMAFDDARRADSAFLAMMRASEVPPVRSHVMWAAVTLRSRWYGGVTRRIGIVAWLLLAILGVGLLAAGLLSGPWRLALIALVLQIPASALWGSQWKAGIVAGYALPVVVLPAAASIGGYGAYWVVEQAVALVRRMLPRYRQVPTGDVPSFRDL
jgi:hypothetical protein